MPEFHDLFCHPLNLRWSCPLSGDGFTGGVAELGKEGSFVTGCNRDEL